MNSFPRYIAKHIKGNKSLPIKGEVPPCGAERVCSSSSQIGIFGIAIGLAVMLITVAIVVGFKEQIQNKIAGFGGHLQVLAIAGNRTFEKYPICVSDSLLDKLHSIPSVADAEPFITKPAVLKTDNDFLSVVVRSETDSLEDNEIVVSQTIANKLNIDKEGRLKLFFVKNGNNLEAGEETSSIKSRTVSVRGFYQSHFNEYDSQIIIASHKFLQKVSGWDEDMASGIEIQLHRFDQLEEGYFDAIDQVSQSSDRRGTSLFVQRIDQQNPQIFGWLDLLDTNVWVILGLMMAVASFTIINGLLIIILERTSMIGILKALGATNWQIQKIFLFVANSLTIRGMFWGNLIGLGLCAIQYYWHPIALDAENYYLDWVPISFNIWYIIFLNIATWGIIWLVLLVPSTLVAKIAPTKAIQSE